MGEPERVLARVTSADIAEVYNGMVGLCVCFDYENGGGQCLSGYMLDAAMVVRFMNAVGVLRLRDAVGKSCWVTHTWSKVLKVEPLHAKDGTAFDVEEWSRWCERRMGPVQLCYSELEGRDCPHQRNEVDQ